MKSELSSWAASAISLTCRPFGPSVDMRAILGVKSITSGERMRSLARDRRLMGTSMRSTTETINFRLLHDILMASLTIPITSSDWGEFAAIKGSVITKLLEVAKVGQEEKMLVRAQVSSRPPCCERRCSSCGHCEAV